MAIGKDGAVRRQLRTLFNVGVVRDLTDGQLLERFATDRGEAAELAFAVLVERHGPMVMRVCEGVLADSHDTQDAFQATFLVLVKRARRLWVRDSLGPWLHQVAYRTASCARATAARHRRLERRAAVAEQETRPERDFELERLLHEEIDRLPERYRAPVVLCDLEGCTYEQASRHLGWPVGTVKSRLSRGRERLRDRLLRRGLVTDVGLFIAGLGSKAPVVSIPPALLDSMAATAVRFAAIGPAVQGSAVSLAEGVLRTMSMTQWWRVAAVLLVAGATASGVEWLGGGEAPGTQGPAAKQAQDVRAGDAPTREVTRGTLKRIVSVRGSIEAAQTVDLYCRVEGQTAIIKLVPEGQNVKKGDVVAELDSAMLQDLLLHQMDAIRRAEEAYRKARLTCEVAEVALVEYTEGVYKEDQRTASQAVERSRHAVRYAEGRLQRTQQASQRITEALAAMGGAKAPADILAELDIRDRLEAAVRALASERRSLEEAERKRDVLEKYTRGKTVKELEGEIGKARADMAAKKALWELEKGKKTNLERQIASCTLVSPMEGKVRYGNSAHWPGGPPAIEEGATVRERQLIVRLYNPVGSMQVNVKVPESEVHLLNNGMTARIKVDAYSDATMEGVIREIAPLPDVRNLFSGDTKVYTTRIQIGQPHVKLVPGFTATAEIAAGELKDVLSVPAGSVVHYAEKDHVAVKTPDGRAEWRLVVLGASDGSNRQVKEGLRAGEPVIIDPRPFLSEEQRATMKAEREAAAEKAAVRTKARDRAQPPR